MKVAFGEDLSRQDSGKHKFLGRLSKALQSQGIDIVNKNADILLHIGRNLDKDRAKRVVMRVDGLWFNKLDKATDKKNKSIKKYMAKSDGIVYQGKFCKQAYRDFFGEKFINSKPNVCIINGANPNEFLPRNPQNFFFAYANWRPHKRLECIEKSFAYAVEHGLDADLIVAGKKSEKKTIPRIKYVGWIDHDHIRKYLSECIAVINLAWLDWQPNVTAEALISNTPVLVVNSGGSAEIVGDSGMIIEEKDSSHWNGNKRHLYEPPSLDIKKIVNALNQMKNYKINVYRPDLYINKIANKYIKFFNSLLE